jgi:fatty acid desaturase
MSAPLEIVDSQLVNPYERCRRSLLSQQRVRSLSHLQPWRPVLDSLWFWAWIIASWAAIARWPSGWLICLAIPVIATRYYALLIVGHDGIHRRLFRSPRCNDWFADLVVFGPIGGITRINNQNHLGHHHHLSTPEDPDLHQFTCTNKYRWSLLVVYLSGMASLWTAFTNVFLQQARIAKSTRRTSPYNLRDFLVIAVWQTALIGGLTWFIAWWAYPVLWMIPVYLAFVADNFRAFAEHSHPEPDSLANHHRLITYLSNPLERLFIAPCNMNYHAAHHLWPSIPYYNLPAADREIRRIPAADALEWRSSYFGYLIRYFQLLPLENCVSQSVEAAHVAGAGP